MSVVSTLKTQVDLPVWEWCRFAQTASTTASSTCTPKNSNFNPIQGRFIFYLATSALFYRYDTWTDSWEVLSPPVTALSTFSSMEHVENWGWEGRVLSATSTTFTAPALTSNLLQGYDVVIVSGTGSGQRRIIKSVAEPVVAASGIATTVVNTAGSYNTGCTLTDSTQSWNTNQWAGYQCRISFGQGVGQIRKILYNSATVLTFSDSAKTGEDYFALPANFNPTTSSTAGSQSVYSIESSVLTVDTAWTTTPDATSRFRLCTGVIILLSGAVATPFYTLQWYDIASDVWYQKTTQTLLFASAPTDGAIEHCSEMASLWERGVATAGSVTSLTDGVQNWTVNQWAGYYVFVFSGTGLNQGSLITSNTATALTLTSTLSVAPAAGSQYFILGFSGGTSSGSNSSTTLNDTTQAWTVNQWTNYQVRILAGTGLGQAATIASNTATALTIIPRSNVSGGYGWGTTPDNTSIYSISGDQDRTYITLGANAITLLYNHDDDLSSLGRMADSGTNRNGSVQYGAWKPLAISTLTSVTTTATCTTVNNHNLQTGYSVIIAGETTNPSKYNITATITVTGATTFTYTIVSTSGVAGTFNTPSTSTLVDATQAWTTNQWANYICYFTVTSGSTPTGFAAQITSNTATVLTFTAAGTAPINGTTRYVIGGTSTNPTTVPGNLTPGTTSGQVTGTVAVTTLADTTKNWVVNLYAGRRVHLTSGTGQGQESVIASNTSTVLTFAAVGTAPVASNTTYAILAPSAPSTGTTLLWAFGIGGPDSGAFNAPTYANAYAQMVAPASNLLWGRYLFVARGGATVGFNRLDLTTDLWNLIATQPISETLTTGSQYAYDGGNRMFFTPQVTGRMYYLDLVSNTIHGGGIIPYTAGTAILSQLIQIFSTPDGLKYLWINRQSNIECFRELLFW